jgi:hypothetical protein
MKLVPSLLLSWIFLLIRPVSYVMHNLLIIGFCI